MISAGGQTVETHVRVFSTAGWLVLLAAVPSACLAQYSVLPDVLSATISNMAVVQQRIACLTGTAAPPAAQEAAKAATQETMQDYARTAGLSPAANTLDDFTRKSKLRAWIGPDGVLGDPRHVDDAIARVATPALGPPSSFIVSGDGLSATGVWTVRHYRDDRPIGGYTASFRFEDRRWLITRLVVSSTPQSPEPPTPYCSVPGDIEKYRNDTAAADAAKAARRAAKANAGSVRP